MTDDNCQKGEKSEHNRRSQNLGQKQAEREETADRKFAHMGDKKILHSDERSRKQQSK